MKSGAGAATKKLARDHSIVVSNSGLVTITGGKWTTYRKMGEDVVNTAAQVGGLAAHASRTQDMPLRGARAPENFSGDAEVVSRFAREEMARTVEDVLSRRTRTLVLDARAAMELAPAVAAALAMELKRDEVWQRAQISSFHALAQQHLWPCA